MKLAVIGGGYWGKNLIRDFHNIGDLHTICDIDEEALKKYNEIYPSIKTTTNWNDILEDPEITRVCIALPAHMHYKYAKQALLNDKDVYVEKPITLDVKEAEDLVKIAKKQQKILMVGHLLHYHPAIKKIKQLVSEGVIGEIKNIIANRFSLGIFRTFENVLWSFAVHDLSIILALCNDKLPKSVVCNGSSHITEGTQDITNSILKYKDKYVNLNVSWLNPYKEQKLTIVGTKGMLVFDDVKKELIHIPEYVSKDTGSPTAIKNNQIQIEYKTDFSPLIIECEHFTNCCETRTQPISNGNEGVRVLKLLNYLQNSLDNNGKEIIIYEPSNIFIHESAIVDQDADIGEGTKIWHYSHICTGAKIGKNCNIGQNVYIAGGAILGDNCKVQNNVSIYSGVHAGNGVFFGPSCVLTNDINPRCNYPKNGEYIKTILQDGVTLGANSTIVCGNTIGANALIGAGAVVCKDVKNNAIIVGNPGKNIGCIDELGNRHLFKIQSDTI